MNQLPVLSTPETTPSNSNSWARSTPPLSATVEVGADSITAHVADARPEIVAAFTALEPGARHLLVHDVWTVGMRVILNARAEAREAQLSNITETFKDDLARQLEQQAERATELIQNALSEYFDPDKGCVAERLKHFVGDGGVLAHELRRHLGTENSTLAATLAKSVGEQSPLFKKLNPTDSEGLVQVLAQQLRRVLQDEHSEFQQALDPLQTEGAVGKFLLQMRDLLKSAESDQAEQIRLALKQLDANDEASLLSQLRRQMAAAQAELLRAVNPAQPDSPLAAIQRTLTTLLTEHIKTQHEREEAARKRDEALHAEILARLERYDTRRALENRSPAGGRSFEDRVVAFMQRLLSPAGYLVEPTGGTPGITRKKTGDATIDFPTQHALHGCRIVVEAKHEEKFTRPRALAELEDAKANRNAQIGVFVLAKSHAPDTFEPFWRSTKDVIVVWDDEDPADTVRLEAALFVAFALAARKQSNASDGNLQALQDIEKRVTMELARLGNVRKAAEIIRSNAEKISEDATKGDQQLRKIIEDAVSTLAALNVDLAGTHAEDASPVVVGRAG